MIHLNEDNGEYLVWKPGEYTVYLNVNEDRSVTEAYYLNNRVRSFSFTIEETEKEPEPDKEEEKKPDAYRMPKTGIS